MFKDLNRLSVLSLVGLFAFMGTAPTAVFAQSASGTQDSDAQVIEPGDDVESSEFVTINVKDANIAEVLKAYSLQTGQSIVVGPDVVSENVNVRLMNIPWEEALDVILKPYGFGYRVVGDTIVISKLENIVTVEGIEPLVSRVFKLGFLDAYDIQGIIEAQLTARGKYTILETKSLPGWEFGG
ncbi:secretin and TonB N-terminal domain-containing protein, partial [Pontiella sp.]|uniref:secretin and TonB N-terminal domain-containing protein n=1 Tax=Pontiella sp. TaxID=2837462 RepID=UPI00356465DF